MLIATVFSTALGVLIDAVLPFGTCPSMKWTRFGSGECAPPSLIRLSLVTAPMEDIEERKHMTFRAPLLVIIWQVKFCPRLQRKTVGVFGSLT